MIPLIGLGTWNLRGRECTHIVKLALECGYRHIDTAHVYENHAAIQKGIKGFDRKQLFITSKIALDQIDPEKVETSVEAACDLALQELGTDYLDLYLIHWPRHTWPMSKVLKAMEGLACQGKIKKAGVSNFTLHHLEDLLNDGCKPAADQVEFHPYLFQKELLDYCRLEKIQLIAYRPLGKGKLLSEPLFHKIGHRYKKNPAQVILRWLVQQDIPTIPKASSEKHLVENFNIFDFTLSPEEMKEIEKLHQNHRFCAGEEFTY